MNISKTLLALLAAAGLCLAGGATAATGSKEARDQANKAAEAQYKTDKARCDGLSGNAKDICMEEAKGKEKVAKAEADGGLRGHAEGARIRAHGARRRHVRSRQGKMRRSGGQCQGRLREGSEGRARQGQGRREGRPRGYRHAANRRNKTAEARKEAAEDKRDAEYKVAVEKCDSLAGAAKDACVRDAKARFGKT